VRKSGSGEVSAPIPDSVGRLFWRKVIRVNLFRKEYLALPKDDIVPVVNDMARAIFRMTHTLSLNGASL
jgi:hypothetical protein